MDIQFVLTESAPVFEFAIPAERNNASTTCMAVISGIADAVDAVEANPTAEPPVVAADAIPANTVNLQYAMPAAVDAAAGSALTEAWVDSGKTFATDGLHGVPTVGTYDGKMRFVLSGERDMRIRFFLL
ncbi:MAG: hypothetical protein EOM03_07690 [Clostridia bacterium]|nr:hypothetical protein [Clostridia bacterium]